VPLRASCQKTSAPPAPSGTETGYSWSPVAAHTVSGPDAGQPAAVVPSASTRRMKMSEPAPPCHAMREPVPPSEMMNGR